MLKIGSIVPFCFCQETNNKCTQYRSTRYSTHVRRRTTGLIHIISLHTLVSRLPAPSIFSNNKQTDTTFIQFNSNHTLYTLNLLILLHAPLSAIWSLFLHKYKLQTAFQHFLNDKLVHSIHQNITSKSPLPLNTIQYNTIRDRSTFIDIYTYHTLHSHRYTPSQAVSIVS